MGSEGISLCPPGEQLDVRVALNQHKAAPISEQRGERGVGDPALDGAVASIAARRVQVLGDGSRWRVGTEVNPPSPKLGAKEETTASLPGSACG